MRYKIVVAYDGTDFSGWQVQDGKRTVQGEIEKAIYSLTGNFVRVTGSGRTDAGVHARGQVAHFDAQINIPPEKICKALNARLEKDVRVLSSEIAPSNFNACRTAKKKTYEYRMYLSEEEIPTKERFSLRVFGVDLKKMKEACRMFKGEHDFKAFCSTGSSALTTTRKIYSCKITADKEDIVLCVKGNGFLYNMVRIIAGTLLGIGMGKISEEDVKKAFETKDRRFAGKTLPAKALSLLLVEYE